jgi:hypothetical protein
MKSRLFRFLIAATVSLAAFAVQALDIKGIRVDEPIQCDRISSLETRLGTLAPACKNKLDSFFTEVSFMWGKATLVTTQSRGLVTSVTLLPGSPRKNGFHFEDTLHSMTAVWGRPELEYKTVRNPAGTEYEQVIASWFDGSQRMVLEKHSGRIGVPSLSLIGAEWQKVRAADAKDKTQRNSASM